MHRRAIVCVAVLLLVASCTGGAEPEVGPTGSASPVPMGGTLRVGSVHYPGADLEGPQALDQSLAFFSDSGELFRCCLTRTLLSYPGRPTREGGTVLQPDLARSMPEVSLDGLVWTFRLREGLRYGPPLEELEIVARDFIRAVERASQGPTSYLYSVIEGFDAFASGEADAIAGLQAPDDHTLRVHLMEPTGDVGERFTLPSSSPIPPNPDDPGAPFGVATGHGDSLGEFQFDPQPGHVNYGGFLVSTGPYMVEGSEALDFSLPPGRQRPASGFHPDSSLVLVRNPSWDPATDPHRGAYVDRIEISFYDSTEEAARAMDEGRIDVVFNLARPPQAPLSQVEAYQSDPGKGFVSIEPVDALQMVGMNLAVPPLDDIHVRKAMNLVVDKAALQERMGGAAIGRIIGHIGLNSLGSDLLLNYDPYGTPEQGGDIDRAREEMALSRYDRDGDGTCDASVCQDLLALAHGDQGAVAEQIAADMDQIGIGLKVELMDGSALNARAFDPTERVPLYLTLGWVKGLPNASEWFQSLFHSSGSGENFFRLGAPPEQLEEWGYSVRETPTVDDRIEACLVQVGDAQLRCWVALDQYLMENVVPTIPYVVFNQISVVPNRLARFSFDQLYVLPALDQVALAPRP